MDIYKQYAELTRQIKDLSDQQAKLKPRILGYVKRVGQPVRQDFGTFSLVEYPRYEYSHKVKQLEAELKELQRQEREAGTAKKQVTETLRFQAK